MTLGAGHAAVDLSEICNRMTKHRRLPSTKICDRVFAAYSIPTGDLYFYDCDHDVPMPRRLDGREEPLAAAACRGRKKDRLEVEMQRLACVAFRNLTPADAAKVLQQEQQGRRRTAP